jgi:hypothetical protein
MAGEPDRSKPELQGSSRVEKSMQASRAGVLAVMSLCASGLEAQTVGIDLRADKVWYEGDFNPGGRISVWSTMTANGDPIFLGREPRAKARVTFSWCTEQRADTCTLIQETTAPIELGKSVDSATFFQDLPLSVGKGTRYLRVNYGYARLGGAGTGVVVDLTGETELSNNEQYVKVETGNPGAYLEFPNKEIDGFNSKKLTKVSLGQCQVACSTETSFVCRSVDYAKKEKECMLQEVMRQAGATFRKPNPPRQIPLTDSPKKKWTHFARPCKFGDHPTKCVT